MVNRKKIEWVFNNKGCHICTSHAFKIGYPTICFNRKTTAILKYFYELKYGVIDAGLNVSHSCGERLCINIEHIILETRQQCNTRRRLRQIEAVDINLTSKICNICTKDLPLDNFIKTIGKFNNDVYHSRCNKCTTLSRFNITSLDYDVLLLKQNNRCVICNCEETIKGKSLAVDHCHKSGKIRGLLCGACNKGLGQFKDDVSILECAIKYLKYERSN